MAKHLSTRHVATIVEILDCWPTGTKLTWEALIKEKPLPEIDRQRSE